MDAHTVLFVILNHDDGKERPIIDQFDNCVTKTIEELFDIRVFHLFRTDNGGYRLANKHKIPCALVDFYKETTAKYVLFEVEKWNSLMILQDADSTIEIVKIVEKYVLPIEPIKHVHKPHLVVMTDYISGQSRVYKNRYESTITSNVTDKYGIGVTNLVCIDHDIDRVIVGTDMYGDVVTRNMRSILGHIFLGFPELPAVVLYIENPLTVARSDVSKKAAIIDYLAGSFDYKSITNWVGDTLKYNGYLDQQY